MTIAEIIADLRMLEQESLGAAMHLRHASASAEYQLGRAEALAYAVRLIEEVEQRQESWLA